MSAQEDQDAIAAQWEASMLSEDPEEAAKAAAENELSGTMAEQWAAMVDDGGRDNGAKSGGERVLSQEEIDNLLGFSVGEVNLDENSGIRAIIDSAMVSYERLPMLEIVFDRLVRLMTTSLRNFTSDNVEVSLDRITSVRFGDYMNSIPLPAVLSVFKAEEWENFGLATVDSSLIYSIIDVLLGGRRGQTSLRIEGRPYTTIETNLVKRLVEVVPAAVAGDLLDRPAGNQPALRRDLQARQCRDPGAAAHRHGRPRRRYRAAAALCDHRADPAGAVADVHGRKIRPRPDLGRPFRNRSGAGRDRRRRRAVRGQDSPQAADEAEDRRHAAAGNEKGRAGVGPLRQRRADRRAHGAGRRPRRHPRHQAIAQATHHLRDVREGRRANQVDGGTMSHSLGIVIESLVAVLLMVTIGYCILLNKRL